MIPLTCCAWLLSALLAVPTGVDRTTYETFIVPAGTVLTLEVQSPVSSSANRKGDQVSGRLQRAIVRGEIELVPAGTMVFGTIEDLEPHAGARPGRLAVRFHVVEHLVTGSRAMIRAGVIAVDGERRKARRFGMPVTRGTEAAIEARAIVTCTLEEPLRVMIPKR